MIKRIILFLSILFPSLCAAQGAGFQSVLLGPTGRPLAGAQVTVCASTATGLPCTPLSSIFADPALTQPISNPIITDSLGNWGFWATPGNYQYSVTGNGITSAGVPTCTSGKACPYLINIPCVVNVSCLTSPTTANIVINSPGSLTNNGTTTTTGPGTHSGTETFTGGLTATSGQNQLAFFNTNNVEWVDGIKYALTEVGVNSAITAVNGRGGGKVLITKPVITSHDIVLKSNVVLECAGGWAQPLITYTGAGAGEHAVFGNNIQDAAVVGCYIKGPDLSTPPIPVLTTSTSGGSLGAAATVFVKITYVNANGESAASTESTITTGAGSTNSVTVTAPWLLIDPAGQPPAHITGYTVYSSTTTGTEKQQAASNACVNIITSCVIQVVGAGANAPSSFSAAASIDARGIEFDGTNRHWEINNKVVGFKYGIYDGNIAGGSESYINNNFVQGMLNSCVVQGDDRGQVNNNRISDCGSNSLDHGIYITATQGVTDVQSIGNQISFVQGYCIQAFDAGTNTALADVRIVGNECQYGGQGSSGSRGGFIVGIQSATDSCNGVTVNGNTASNISGTAVIQVGNCSKVSITGNTISSYSGPVGITISTNLAVNVTDIAISGNTVAGGANIASGDNAITCIPGGGGTIQNVSISGGVINQNPFHGIKIYSGCTDGTISGMSIMNFNQQNGSANGIDIEAGANGWTITGNRIRSVTGTSSGIGIAGGNDNLVTGNDLVNNATAFFDLGTRTQIAGNKINATDALFRINSQIGNAANTATMGLTLKKGSGAGNYTTANTTYTVADSTNLCFTVTIPTGWKLSVDASGALGTATAAVLANVAITDNAACSTANAGILVESTTTGTAAGVLEGFSLNWVITGDGASHNVALQYKTSAGADVATLQNSSATALPTMVFTLMPSN